MKPSQTIVRDPSQCRLTYSTPLASTPLSCACATVPSTRRAHCHTGAWTQTTLAHLNTTGGLTDKLVTHTKLHTHSFIKSCSSCTPRTTPNNPATPDCFWFPLHPALHLVATPVSTHNELLTQTRNDICNDMFWSLLHHVCTRLDSNSHCSCSITPILLPDMQCHTMHHQSPI